MVGEFKNCNNLDRIKIIIKNNDYKCSAQMQNSSLWVDNWETIDIWHYQEYTGIY